MFGYQVLPKEDHVVLKLKGKLITQQQGQQIIENTLECFVKDNTQLVIDLKELKYLSSIGIGVLVQLLTTARKNNGDITLVDASEVIMKLLRITKLDQVFTYREAQNV